ncbi:ras GEF [Teratosphaeria nubilosa]|uniref:Ras GEF n=1 Tax=Teratosphaeria nubilosa TaxID=161662 RepID=A0A6G1L0H0_9PEZI|nr:ras GEF [Teratosphaeria nubilosa]
MMERSASQHGASMALQERPSRPSLQTGISKGMAIHVQMTPPDTPICPHGDHGDPSTGQHMFHNYLRAFYPYDPSTSVPNGDDSLLSTVAIKPGDLILIHSVHANGWADGTVLSSGARGWLPTNYCEAYDHPYMRNLLNAMTQFWDLLRANDEANLSTFVRQDYIRGLIAGVRYLLEHADCLHRDAVLVQRYVGIRRTRKGLLAHLSSLVQIAKNLQETISEPFAGEVVHYLIEDLVTQAFKVVTRATSFVDIWLKENAEYRAEVKRHEGARDPATPPLDMDHRVVESQPSQASRAGVANPADPAKSAASYAAGIANSPAGGGAETADCTPPNATSPLSSIVHVRAGSVSHRLSLVEADRAAPSGLASDQLAKVHDACISHIGAFIGHHLHSRPSRELMQTTERLVTACKNMLAIATEVHARDGFRSASVQKAREDFDSKLDELCKATKDAFKFSDLDDCDVISMPEQSGRLVSVGTGLIRVAGVCVVRTRALIEQVGDFELDKPPAPVSSPPHSPAVEQTSFSHKRESRPMTSFEKRLSRKVLPPPPPIRSSIIASGSFDFGLESPAIVSEASTPMTPNSTISQKSLHALPWMHRRSLARLSGTNFVPPSQRSRPASRVETSPARKGSVGMSIAGSTDTVHSSARDSGISHVSEGSTRATTPEHGKHTNSLDPGMLDSSTSVSSMPSGDVAEVNETEAANDAEARLLLKTYASELTLNQNGQVTGGSLPALIEQLTPNDAAPEPQFATAFYVTFRMFTSPRELAQALVERFVYAGENKAVCFRIYNVFKGWLETYWNADADKDALGDIRCFALHKLKPFSQSAGDRLLELIRKVTAASADGTLCGPLVSGVGKTTTSIGHQQEDAKSAPEPVISKSQLNTLRSAVKDGGSCTILDFDPLELARQFTLMTSKVFCSIQPDELLSLQWNKPDTQVSPNVRGMIKLNTALANVVGDTTLAPEDAKKRALIIKHWTKIAQRCLDLKNYDSLMSIMASLNSSVIKRLKRTWEMVSKKTKGRFDELNLITDSVRNHAALRKRLEEPVAPCIPFLGITLTDLTMLAEYYPKTKELPGAATDNGEPVTIINFDKHAKMAKVVCHLQKFQVPYKLQTIPEMQTWMESSMQKMNELGSGDNQTQFFRRSLVIEPKADIKLSNESKRSNDNHEDRPKTAGGKERWEMFMKNNSFSFKTSHPDLPSTENFHNEKHASQDRKHSVITVASTATGDTKDSQASEKVVSSQMEWN